VYTHTHTHTHTVEDRDVRARGVGEANVLELDARLVVLEAAELRVRVVSRQVRLLVQEVEQFLSCSRCLHEIAIHSRNLYMESMRRRIHACHMRRRIHTQYKPLHEESSQYNSNHK
jgi:energy-coupling factor transporter ATP-binding protein EcfA2